MRMTEYIEVCQALLERHGDGECVDAQDGLMEAPEFQEDGNGPVYVCADSA
jgi:hypothetical protein